jgi:hypothetical protein
MSHVNARTRGELKLLLRFLLQFGAPKSQSGVYISFLQPPVERRMSFLLPRHTNTMPACSHFAANLDLIQPSQLHASDWVQLVAVDLILRGP